MSGESSTLEIGWSFQTKIHPIVWFYFHSGKNFDVTFTIVSNESSTPEIGWSFHTKIYC